MKILSVVIICIYISCVYGSFNSENDPNKAPLNKDSSCTESSNLDPKQSQIQVASFLLLFAPLVTWMMARLISHFRTKTNNRSTWFQTLIDIAGITSTMLVLVDALYGSNLANVVLIVVPQILIWIRWILMDILYLGCKDIWNFIQSNGFSYLGPIPYLFQMSLTILGIAWFLHFIGIISIWKYSNQNTWYKFTLCSVCNFPWCRKKSKKSDIAENAKDYYEMDDLFSPKPGSRRPGIPFQFNRGAKQRVGSPLPRRVRSDEKTEVSASDGRLAFSKSSVKKPKRQSSGFSDGNSYNSDNDTFL